MRKMIRSLAVLLAVVPAATLAQSPPQTLPANSVYGRLGIGTGPGQAIPISKLLQNVISPNSVPNSALAQMPAATFKCNPSASIANAQDCTIQGLTFNGSPDANNDRFIGYSASTGTLYATSAGLIAAAATAGVTSFATKTGAITLGNGLAMSSNVLNLSLGNGLTTSGASLIAAIGAGLTTSGGNTVWTASTAPYTNSGTGGTALTVQQRLEGGIIYSADFGTVCDGSTNDFTHMSNFLTALSARGNAIGIINSATSGNTNCIMGDNSFAMPPGSTIMCSMNMTLTFTHNGPLIVPAGGASGRTFRGTMIGCNVNGTSKTTYSSSYCISTLNGSEYVFARMQLNNCGVGIYVTNTDPVNYGSNYNRFEDVIIGTTGNYAIRLDGGSNSNDFRGVRTVDSTYGVYCSGNQNTFSGMQIETYTATGFEALSGCVGSFVSGIRFEGGVGGIKWESGANSNTVIGAYCTSLSGSGYTDSGTGNSKTGGNC